MCSSHLGTSKLQGIEQIRDTWDAEGDMAIHRSRMVLGILIEYATEDCEAIVDIVNSLVSGLPSYNPDADDHRQRLVEL